ncbi:thiamine pyrophosphate-dependent dehydrogenase E1 component subunit alpha [Micromonospora sp. C51]|uniref:thiamine pyrophosphate-dependent dehydrogenase E1 component subunit alpha n=1 Tax=Micromonospora sp. C51 TaxID=2824879 RepID=UPI001B39A6BE|nr:thiamine pyrophosphate-dependent dehydrogenase E1 component subunit alpha [Micromonospora sp. C51]MBQ1047590.1 thiamine pyrophosphate-dependent dehydrogenase E1 component subunit alpha [Micromonospora sp. C51]
MINNARSRNTTAVLDEGVGPPSLSRLSDADLSAMLLIRHFEKSLLKLFEQGFLHGTTHTCLGQEYVPVALTSLLRDDDHIFSNHRGHGHYLARYADPEGLLAELLGRAGAVCGGVGGSQHLLRERFLSTGVQGQSLPVATGVALHLKRSTPGALACVYTGDGTWGEGVVYEALNIAARWELPLLVVTENNGIAQSTPTGQQMAGDIGGRAAAFGIAYERFTDADVTRLRAALRPLVEQVRRASRPFVVEFVTHRLGPHSKGDDSRSPAELRAVRAADWAAGYAAGHPEQFERIDAEQSRRVERIVAEVLARPLTAWSPR